MAAIPSIPILRVLSTPVDDSKEGRDEIDRKDVIRIEEEADASDKDSPDI